MKIFCAFSVVAVAAIITLIAAGCGAGNPPSQTGTPLGSASASTVPSGSQLGYVWMNSDATLRPILGVPGGSRLGASAIAARTYATAAASSVAQVALVVDKTGALLLLHLSGGPPIALASGLPSSPSIAFSVAGTSAVAYAPGGNSFWSITGMPAAPLVQQVKLAAPLTEVAVHDSGAVMIAAKTATATTISTWTSLSGTIQIAAIKGFGGMTFLPASSDALIADSITGDMLRVVSALSSGTPQVNAVAHGLKQPYAIGASVDGHWALVAHAGGLSRLDVTGASPAVLIACACTATQISPLAGTGLFRITEATQAPAWMVDIAAQQPTAYFIPPVAADKGGAQ
jgi:hypothetical protein